MKKKQIKKIEKQMTEIGINLNSLESLSRILINSMLFNDDLKNWDIENLAYVLDKKILKTKQRFNKVVKVLKI